MPLAKPARTTPQFNPSQGTIGSLTGGAGFNRGAAGSKTYGMGRTSPNMGKTTSKAGYGKRDASQRARANAIQQRLRGM